MSGANTIAPAKRLREAVVTVQELETGKTQAVRLEAGKTLRAAF